jgi:acyl transferase domain-containing protein
LLILLDYEQVCLRDPDWQPQYAATGNGIAIMANRISHFFNLHGPSMTIDTGCSGSLVSVHLASQSLRAKETSLVGAISTISIRAILTSL